ADDRAHLVVADWGIHQVALAGVQASAALDDQGQRRRVVAELVVVAEDLTGAFHRLVVERVAGLAGHGVVLHQPVLRPAHHLADDGHQDLLLRTTLETELATEVTKLAELSAGETGEATLHAEVDRALA